MIDKLVTSLRFNEIKNEQQAHSMIPKIDRYTDTLKQALTRQRQKV